MQSRNLSQTFHINYNIASLLSDFVVLLSKCKFENVFVHISSLFKENFNFSKENMNFFIILLAFSTHI